MAPLAGHLSDQRAGFSASQDEQLHSEFLKVCDPAWDRTPAAEALGRLFMQDRSRALPNLDCATIKAEPLPQSALGSQSSVPTRKLPGPDRQKKLSCSRRTTSETTSSSITNVRLISDAPCEIMRTLMSRPAAENVAPRCPASREYSRPPGRRSPCGPDILRPPASPGRRRSRGMASLESTVSETLTSEVDTTSTATAVPVEDVEDRLQKIRAPQHAGAATSTIVMRFLAAMALNGIAAMRRARRDARALVAGIARSSARRPEYSSGWRAARVAGCSTLAPKYASSAASSKPMHLDAPRIRTQLAGRWSSCRPRRSRSRCARHPVRRPRWRRKNPSRRGRWSW